MTDTAPAAAPMTAPAAASAAVTAAADPTHDAFRAMMRDFPTGVAVITTCDDGGAPRGMTCSSLCSVTLDPPMLLVCLRTASPTFAAVRQQGRFAVNLLHGDAQPVAELFASGRPDRFEQVRWRREPEDAGPHLVDDAHVIADCAVSALQDVGDHTVVFGSPNEIVEKGGHRPLLYGRRRYHTWPTH